MYRLVCILLIVSSTTKAQKFNVITENETTSICNTYFNTDSLPPSKEIIEIVAQILEISGLSSESLKLANCLNIDNVIAKIITENGEDIRYIIYDSNWLKSVINSTENGWSVKFILAHEIGHHLNGHSLNNSGNTLIYELQADYFAGKALANLGASLEETLAVTNQMGKLATNIHPARIDRIREIKKGWRSLKEKKEKVKNITIIDN